MIRNENSYCVKLVSNSGKKINNNQIAEICHKFSLPIDFFVHLREVGYYKVWFTLTKDKEFTTFIAFAYQFYDGDILNFENEKKNSEIQKEIIEDCTNIKLPRNDVIVDEYYLDKINEYIEYEKYSVVIQNFTWELSELPKSNINWKKTIRIDIQKYNEDQLKIIAKQYQLIEWRLLYLKRLKAICVYWDTMKPFFLAFQLKDDSQFFLHEKYKGLKLWNSYYSFLTKKDKDKLLKIPPVTLNTKKSSIIKNNETTIQKQIIPTQLTVDLLLDKIIVSGLSSLSNEERSFLDSHSH